MTIHSRFTPGPKMDGVFTILSRDPRASTRRRREELAALQTLATWCGIHLQDMPASIAFLRDTFANLAPHVLGVTPKRLANVKTLCLSAVGRSGIILGMFHQSSRRAKTPEWQEFFGKLRFPYQRNSLSRLVTCCSRNGISPEGVDTEVIGQVMAEMARTSLRPNQHRVHRAMAKTWNEIVDIFPEKRLQKVAVPPSRLRRTNVPLDQLTEEFLEDWANFSTWAQGDDVFADDARPHPLKQTTLDTYFRRLHHAISLLDKAGLEAASIRSLADLVKIDTFKSILSELHSKAKGEASTENFFIARILIQIARDWVKADEASLVELKRLADKLPRPIFQMTRKNKLLVCKFDDPQLQSRFLTAPDRIWQEVEVSQRRGSWRLAEAQASLGLNVLMYMPVRLGNLTNLEFDKHLCLRDNSPSSLRLSEEETKTGAALDFEISKSLAGRLIKYRDEIAPAVIGHRPRYLFSNVDGTVKGFAAVRDLVQRYLKQYVGIHMNPHAYRHLAAKLILDERPDAHVLVQHLLGHKKLETTVKFYAGLDTKRAGRHHQALLEKALAEAALAKARAARSRR